MIREKRFTTKKGNLQFFSVFVLKLKVEKILSMSENVLIETQNSIKVETIKTDRECQNAIRAEQKKHVITSTLLTALEFHQIDSQKGHLRKISTKSNQFF